MFAIGAGCCFEVVWGLGLRVCGLWSLALGLIKYRLRV